jgi:hypothetical protein
VLRAIAAGLPVPTTGRRITGGPHHCGSSLMDPVDSPPIERQRSRPTTRI